MSLLQSDGNSAASIDIGGHAGVRVVQMLWGHLLYDSSLSDLDHIKSFIFQSGQKESSGVQLSCLSDVENK